MKGAQPIKTKTSAGGGPSRGGKDEDSDDSQNSMRDTHADSNYMHMNTEAERMLKRANKDEEIFGKLQSELEDAVGGPSLEDRILRGNYRPTLGGGSSKP